jgi:hypothetical protein
MFMSHTHTAGQNHTIKIGNKSFERVEQVKYFGITLTDLNCIHEGIKSGLNSGNARYHSVQYRCLPICYPGT